jgi:hypothetical protein
LLVMLLPLLLTCTLLLLLLLISRPAQRSCDVRREGESNEAAPTPRNQGTEAPLRNKKVCHRLGSPKAFDW